MKPWSGAILLLLPLAACNAFDIGLGADPKTTKYERSKTSEEQTADDLAACRAQANAVIARDDRIDDSIAAQHDTGTGVQAAPELQRNMDAYGREQRYREIVNDCMRGRGYVLPQD
jgi:hypothetical protein